MTQHQYQSRAEPLFSGPEEVRPDKWSPKFPDQIRKPVALAALLASFFFVESPVPVAAAQYPDSTKAARAGELGGAFLVEPLHDALGWAALYPERVPRAQRIAAEAEHFKPLITPAPVEAVTPDKWAPEYLDQVRLRDAAANTVSVLVEPLHDALGWAALYPDHLRRPAGPVDPPTHFKPLVTPAPVEAVTLDKWTARYPDFLHRKVAAREGLYAKRLTTPPEVFSADKWAPAYPNRIDRRAYNQRSVLVASPAPVAPDQWYPKYLDQVRRKRLPPTQVLIDPTGLIPAVDQISWLAVYPDRLHLRALFQTGEIRLDTEPLAVFERVQLTLRDRSVTLTLRDRSVNLTLFDRETE